jgi:hypothetical protein
MSCWRWPDGSWPVLSRGTADRGRLIAVWIGWSGVPRSGSAASRPEGAEVSEYNLKIDIAAAQVVFDSPIQLWQVPRDAYRQALVSFRTSR